ncbi:putative ABC transporter [Trypanosoma rangeli]|uniref:Putative ABC transporter n=1 Tax=Trypanosoma rangeli TaxID=5698 RepID=A0A3R7K7R6_TRYRA|nr:putative ABC transporter [Trypanosoma rangeli]RNF01361.1 putative ABC transporter [Trypanosoma rangeli]|eukprot:RNF01361.1 putative ABC transporter [Trypanosoma rangeli]
MRHIFTDPLVDLVSVSFQHPCSEGVRGGIRDVCLRVNGGDRVLVVGHNGSGKSTLLSLIAGRRKASTGRATVLGSDAFDNTRLQQHVTLIGQPWPTEALFATTVGQVTTPAPLPERRQRVADALHLNLGRAISSMSSGERRRVQILHGFLHKSWVYLLDECSTDIDVAERKTVLDLVKSECVAHKSCCLYATHILDGVSDWATHLLLLQKGTVVDFKRVLDIKEPLEEFVCRFLTRRHHRFGLTSMHAKTQDECSDDKKVGDTVTPLSLEKEAVIVCDRLQYKDVFRDFSLTVYKGERVLLCGCNGAGKSTLMNMMGGKQFFNNRARSLCILGKASYDDMTLNSLIAFGGDWWVTAPPGEMHVHEIMQIKTPRAERLRELLEVDLSWDVRHISAGEQKRVQLLFHLLEDKPIVLLDEATSDLDLDQRHGLLSFLYSESVNRGVTVVYATHIFGGLEDWPSAVVMLDRTTQGLHALWRGNDVKWKEVTKELFALKSRENF